MPAFLSSKGFLVASQLLIGAVWIFHGLYSKLLRGLPRHEAIVARVLGERHAPWATRLIGAGEMAVGIWVLSGWEKVPCASAQTVALVAMNTLEIWLARELLISAIAMLVLNASLLGLAWNWAVSGFRH